MVLRQALTLLGQAHIAELLDFVIKPWVAKHANDAGAGVSANRCTLSRLLGIEKGAGSCLKQHCKQAGIRMSQVYTYCFHAIKSGDAESI